MTSRLSRGLHRALVGFAAVAACSACASGAGSTRDPFSGGGGSGSGGREGIRVEVQNTNFNQATVEAHGIGVRRRLGRVGGNETARFTLDWGGAGPLYFEIDLLGGGTCTTRPVDVAGGDAVRVIIESMSRIRSDGLSRLCDVMRAR